jgi:succinyl-CoA synthetase alpha subunit
MTGLTAERLDALLDPGAVTIVGASPNGFLTEHLLRNFANHSCRFRGDVHFVNPGYRRLFGRPCVPTVADIEGELGVVYLLLGLKDCMPVLEALPSRPRAVVVFAEGSPPGAVERHEDDIARWGDENGVPILGPQSNGLVSVNAGLLGLLVPVVERLRPGGVALLAQSGGVLGGMVKQLSQRGVGLHSALEYGTACQLPMEQLGSRLLERDDVRLIGVYADGVGSTTGFAAMLRRARELGKLVVFMIGGRSDAGRRAAASHSGMAATPRAVLTGLADQYGALSVGTLDELVWSIEAVAAVGFARHRGPGVALFSDSGGGNVAMADALELAGVPLREPSAATKAELRVPADEQCNPVDFGSASMGHADAVNDITATMAADRDYGICAYASILGIPRNEQSVHLGHIDDFAHEVAAAGKVPFVAGILPFLPDDTVIGTAVVGMGSIESAAKLRALTMLADDSPPPATVADSTTDGGAVAVPETGGRARAALADLGLSWPAAVEVGAAVDLPAELPMAFPVIVKSEAGLPHRQKLGGVLHGVADAETLRHAVEFLVRRFGGPVSIARMVRHETEYFVGAYRVDGDVVLLFGPGGGSAEQTAAVRVAPLDGPDLARWTRRAGAQAAAFADLLARVQDWMLAHEDVVSLDLNPVTVDAGRLVALDAKIERAW